MMGSYFSSIITLTYRKVLLNSLPMGVMWRKEYHKVKRGNVKKVGSKKTAQKSIKLNSIYK